jgi:glycosyltransferase involved in cell wall biosynthesis
VTGRVAIVFWEGYVGVSPSVVNGVRVLSDSGYEVDLVTRSADDFGEAPTFGANVRVIRLPPAGLVANGPLRWLRRRVASAFEPLRFIALCWWTFRGRSYVSFVGIDMKGLLVASLLGLVKRVPVAYWSLEILYSHEFTRWSPMRFCKFVERLSHRRASFTIVQDDARARSLSEENGVNSSRFVIVPNSPLGPPPNILSDYFQTKFGLPSGTRIILHAGMIHPETQSLELATAASGWPTDWRLVLHERAKRRADDPYLMAVRNVGNAHLLLSLDPVPYDSLDVLMSSATIGLVLYDRALGPNFNLVAGASGKLAHYVRCGLPVVSVGLDSVSETLDRYECGVGVDDISQVEGAIATILSEYDRYRANAIRCYVEAYDFGPHFRHVVSALQDLQRAS